jgi:UDP-N-acetylglucosamine diphosphorylase / glucose-1-phosphate thymidylyltransferase / UDP-N-acetylgalactosamine diphosphorylase / glucosamine-1-phosphate N-acetyltransferase / galactosamine-1-phosphate N-acetyltransferase
MLGINTKIGFNCDIARTYFEGHDRIAHQNVILDSIIGKNVWFGGYSGTVNVLLDRKNVRYKISDRLVDTGADHWCFCNHFARETNSNKYGNSSRNCYW